MFELISTIIMTVITVLFIGYAVGAVWENCCERRLEKKE